MNHRRAGWWRVPPVAIAIVLALPIVVVAGFALTGSGEIWQHLASTVLPEYLKHSLWLAVGVGVGTAVLGTTTAWLTATCRFPGQRWFNWLLLLPLALPAYIVAYAYTGALDYAGPVQTLLREVTGWGPADYRFPNIRSLPGAIIVLTLTLYPYVYLLARAAFLTQSTSAMNVARSMGLSPFRAFSRVALPLARPAIVTGVALVLMETMADYGTVKYFGVTTFTTGIFRAWFGMGEPRAAAQLACSLLGLVLLLLLIERWSRRQRRYAHNDAPVAHDPMFRLGGAKAVAAWSACALPVGFGFLAPAGQLAYWSLDSVSTQSTRGFMQLLGNSVLVASICAGVIVFAGLLLTASQRLRPGWSSRAAIRVAGTGYAVPGAVIAIGVIIPLAWLDNTVDAFMRDAFGLSTGLLLSGTLFALVFACTVRFLAVSLQTLEAGFVRISPGLDDAARSMGCSPFQLLRRIYLPLLNKSLLTAALLVFVDVMKELPATLILRPFDFNTLAVRAYELAEDEQLAAAAPSALAIVLTGLLPVIILSRAIARRDNHA